MDKAITGGIKAYNSVPTAVLISGIIPVRSSVGIKIHILILKVYQRSMITYIFYSHENIGLGNIPFD